MLYLLLLLLFTLFSNHAASLTSVPTKPDSHIALHTLDNVPVIHFTLARRGGVINATAFQKDYVNLPNLTYELEKAEARFNLTKREVKGNKLVRKAKSEGGGDGDGVLMGNVATEGVWYASISIGNPAQEIEMDLNMLVSDFYVVTTSSREGSRFDEFFSQSYGERVWSVFDAEWTWAAKRYLDTAKSNKHPHPTCGLPMDVFHLPTIGTEMTLEFAHCRPSKSSLKTLGASGSTLGLAPGEHLSQTKSTSILKQLLDKAAIQRPIFSLMLINGHEGVLSIGGTAASAIEMVVSQTKEELDRLGKLEQEEVSRNERPEETGSVMTLLADLHDEDAAKRLKKRGRANREVAPRQASWEDGWAWTKVQGAEGWWQILMQSVNVDGVKVLKNQAVVIDINSPFIMAPPIAAKAFYASVSGSRRLPPPYDSFYAFPCLNPPTLHFEFGGSMFPFMQGGRAAQWTGLPGGRFSLGRLEEGSGYCIGAVVETRMGVKDEKSEVLDAGRRGTRPETNQKILGGNGMRDVWVIGEGFFRGVGGVFDFKEHRVGFRTS